MKREICGSSADGEWANPGYVAPAVSDEMLSSLVKAQNGQEQAKVTAAARERLASIREMGRKDVLGLSCVTMGQRISEVCKSLFEADDYQQYLYMHGMGVETAEAFAETPNWFRASSMSS